jgi:hypothetical protein
MKCTSLQSLAASSASEDTMMIPAPSAGRAGQMFDFGPSHFGNRVLQVLLDQVITTCSLIHSIFAPRLIAARSNAL